MGYGGMEMIKPINAKTLYIMLMEADECSSYHELYAVPMIARV